MIITKKIINGKKYDTDTATFIACDSMYPPNDFNFWSEELYRKKTGEFFLYGRGGANSKYNQPGYTGGWEGSERIIPFTEIQAREWMEKHSDADKYEEVFGEVEEKM